MKEKHKPFVFLFLLVASLFIFSCQDKPGQAKDKNRKHQKIEGTDMEKIVKTESEWKEILTPQQYRILRKKGTERACTGPHLDQKADGIYKCVGCGNKVFKSNSKFKSGTGWPSFYEPYNSDNIITKKDLSYGMIRTEVLCARCDGHLGHVFKDGPEPTGLRYCINGTVLDFEEASNKVE